MCGRYVIFTDPASKTLTEIVREAEHSQMGVPLRVGEIFPTNYAPVLQAAGACAMKWGFPHFRGSGVIINAVSETAAQKRMFAASLQTRRCVVPASGFFEWKVNSASKTKTKYLFTLPEKQELYMAGLWNEFAGENRFVILTTKPNQSVADIHNRMPLVLMQNQIRSWLLDTDAAMQLLKQTPPLLDRSAV